MPKKSKENTSFTKNMYIFNRTEFSPNFPEFWGPLGWRSKQAGSNPWNLGGESKRQYLLHPHYHQ